MTLWREVARISLKHFPRGAGEVLLPDSPRRLHRGNSSWGERSNPGALSSSTVLLHEDLRLGWKKRDSHVSRDVGGVSEMASTMGTVADR